MFSGSSNHLVAEQVCVLWYSDFLATLIVKAMEKMNSLEDVTLKTAIDCLLSSRAKLTWMNTGNYGSDTVNFKTSS